MIPTKPSNVTWTDEQWEAIYEDNKNIIVSAGAGSGKTAYPSCKVLGRYGRSRPKGGILFAGLYGTRGLF